MQVRAVVPILFAVALASCTSGGGDTSVVSPQLTTLATPSSETDPGSTEPVSDSPRDYDGKPVQLVETLGPDEIQVDDCPLNPNLEEREPVAEWRSSDGFAIAFTVTGSPGLQTCDGIVVDAELEDCGGSYTRFADDPEKLEASGGGLDICGDTGSDTRGFLWLALPDGARWVLVDQGEYWAGYRAPPSRIVRAGFQGGFGPGFSATVRVAYFGKDGQLLDERDVEGYVAG